METVDHKRTFNHKLSAAVVTASSMTATMFAVGLAFGLFLATSVEASVYSPGDPGFLTGYTVTPSDPIDTRYSDLANVDVGGQDPANVEAVLETAIWFGDELSFADLDFVGGGACDSDPTCDAFDVGGGPSGKGGTSTLTAQIFAVHFDNKFIAFLFGVPVSDFMIEGLRQGVSNIYAFNVSAVPLPAAFPLFASALAFAGLWRTRKRRASVAATA